MNKTLGVFCLSLMMLGCASQKPAEPTVKVVTEMVETAIYQPPDPEPLRLENVQFRVITRKNLESSISEIEHRTGQSFVIYAITPRDYENIAYNMQEMRRLIKQLQEINNYYKTTTKTSESWIEKNDQKISDQKKQFESHANSP